MRFSILEEFKKFNYTYYSHDRYNLDHISFDSYQDEGEEFFEDIIWESDRNNTIREIPNNFNNSMFSYFLDGSRLTYKVADIETSNRKFLPLIAGQIAAGVTKRENKQIKKHELKKENIIVVPSDINPEDLLEIEKSIKEKVERIPYLDSMDIKTYDRKSSSTRPENFGIAIIQAEMRSMEISILQGLVNSNYLRPDASLIIDGSLQFVDANAKDRLFANVVGISKSFNPNLEGLLKRKRQQIATLLTDLSFGQRTPVFKYNIVSKAYSTQSHLTIGAWYLRIRSKVKNPLDGILKVEKVAFNDYEKNEGFDTDLINNLSHSIILERNVTCYGKDSRWSNHLYPVYLTERMLKDSFLSNNVFLNLF